MRRPLRLLSCSAALLPLLLGAAASSSSSSSSSHVRWLGCTDDWDPAFHGAINMMAASSNLSKAVANRAERGLPTFWGDSCFPGATNCSGRGGPVQGPKGCLKNGGCWSLAPEWEAAVDATAAALAPLVANGTVVGIFVGDEMVCNGLPFENFTALVRHLRAKVGPTLKLWANECCGTVTGANGGPGEWLHVPPELDYVSYDCYSVPELVAGSDKYHWNGSAEVAMARAAYEREIYPLLAPHQRVMQLPGLFGWNQSQCPMEQQAAALIEKLSGYWSWAQEDSRVVGLAPWHMNDRSSHMGPNLGPGAINFPTVMAKLRSINAQIGPTTPPPPTPPPPPSAEPSLVSLFPRGEHNVDCYFGPILFAVPGSSTLVALTEARLFSCNDAGPKRIAMRRSIDHGLTWEPITFIWNDTALPTLPSKEARWKQWNKMGGTNCKNHHTMTHPRLALPARQSADATR